MMNLLDLEKLRNSLPSDYAVMVKEKTITPRRKKGFSLSAIYKVIMGIRYNIEIMDAAIEVAKEHKQKIENQKTEIENL